MRTIPQYSRDADGRWSKKLRHLDVHARPQDEADVAHMFPYLADRKKATGGGDVPALRWRRIPSSGPGAAVDDSFTAGGVAFRVWDVPHGSTTCSAFRFGDVAYVSDVSNVPDGIAQLEGLELLIIDALSPSTRVHPSHLNVHQARDVVARYRPKKTLFVGMAHSFDHDVHNKSLPDDQQLAFDGQVIELDGQGRISSMHRDVNSHEFAI